MHIPAWFSLKTAGYRQLEDEQVGSASSPREAPIKTVQGIQHSNPTSGNATFQNTVSGVQIFMDRICISTLS